MRSATRLKPQTDSMGIPLPNVSRPRQGPLGLPKTLRSVVSKVARRILVLPPETGLCDVLDFGDAGGVVVAGYLPPIEMDALRQGKWPASWKRKPEPAAPEPEQPVEPAKPKTLAEARTAQDLKDIVEDTTGQRPEGEDGPVDFTPPPLLPDYETVAEEESGDPNAAAEAQTEAAMDRLKREGRVRDLTRADKFSDGIPELEGST